MVIRDVLLPPNDPSSATAATRRADCNREAPRVIDNPHRRCNAWIVSTSIKLIKPLRQSVVNQIIKECTDVIRQNWGVAGDDLVGALMMRKDDTTRW